MRRFTTPSIRQPLMWTIAAVVAVWLAGCTPDSPVTHTQETVTGTQEVVTGTQEAVTGTQEAVTGIQEVVTGTQEAVTGIQEVVTGTQEVVTGTQEAVTEEAAAESESADGDSPETASTPATPAGMAFLAENGEREGVVTTPSGLQYEVLASGDGATPGPTDTVTTHYHGTFVDGRIFDSSVQRGVPASFPVNRVIKGWTEALQMMKVGDKWKIVCPPDLAYGEQGRSGIPPRSTLIFEVELLDVKTSG